MTTKQQRGLYFPLWQAVARVHHWRMIRGRLVGTPATTWGGPETTALYDRVWNAAETLARQHARAITADDLRHACTVVALGRDKSSTDFSNSQLDRVVALFRLLVDPDDIDALLAWSNPAHSERDRLVYTIKRIAPFAYIDHLCRDRFASVYNHPYWEDLPLPALRQLHMTLKTRQRAEPVAEAVPAAVAASAGEEDDNAPF